MSLDSAGRLGIGTSSPDQKLQVEGTGSQYVAVTSTDSDNTGILFGDSDIDSGYVLYANSDNSLRIGANAGERMRISSAGGLFVGQTSVTSNSGNPSDGIHVGNAGTHIGATHIGIGDSVATARWRIQTGAYNLSFSQSNISGSYTIRARVNNSTGTYTAVSDQRAKKNITNSSYGIDELKQLRPVSYYMNDQDETTDRLNLGFIAQEVLSVIPEAVNVPADPEEMYGLESSALIPVLVSSLQQAVAKIETLETKVAALEAAE